MVRNLKFHEQKLLKKVDFLNVRALVQSMYPQCSLMSRSGSKMEAYERLKS